MKKIKCLAVLAIFLIAVCVVPGAYAIPVNVNDSVTITQGIGGGNSGGSFDIYDTNTLISFNTFCLEKNEYITPNGTTQYIVSNISLASIKGGVGGPSPDPIDYRTAFLYSQWLSGDITNNKTNANALQLAIWYLEEEITKSEMDNNYGAAGILAGTFVTDATGANGYYGIQVMNLQDVSRKTECQSMLVPVPEPLTLLLLGLGLFGIGVVKRKKN